MTGSNIVAFGENPATATRADGLAFIERTRRQLDRSEQALPNGDTHRMPPEEITTIRRQLDALEASIRKDIGDI